jgi:predicted DNA-binding transcriptional regulator AlpA
MQSLELLDAVAVAAILKVSESSIWNWQYGRKTPPVGFPPPVKIGTIGAVALIGHSCVHSGAADSRPPGEFRTRNCSQPHLPQVVALDKPVRGRGRPRKMQPGGMR